MTWFSSLFWYLLYHNLLQKNIQEVYEAYGLRHMGVSVAFFFVIWCVTLDYYLETFDHSLSNWHFKKGNYRYIYISSLHTCITLSPWKMMISFDFRITDIIEIIFFCLIIKYKNVVCLILKTRVDRKKLNFW